MDKTNSSEQMREAFEAWYAPRHDAVDFSLRPDGQYDDWDIALQWNAWQAAPASQQPSYADLEEECRMLSASLKDRDAKLAAAEERIADGAPDFDDRPDAYLYKTACPWDIAMSRVECTYGGVPAARIVPVWFVGKEWKCANRAAQPSQDQEFGESIYNPPGVSEPFPHPHRGAVATSVGDAQGIAQPVAEVGERKDFEKFLRDEHPYLKVERKGHTYESAHAHYAWSAWETRAALAQSPTRQEPPKLVLTLPIYDRRRLIVVSDDTEDGERLVCVAIQDAQPGEKA